MVVRQAAGGGVGLERGHEPYRWAKVDLPHPFDRLIATSRHLGLTMTQRQPSMLAVVNLPPTTSPVQGPAIYVRGLEKSYKELRVLRGVDFDVARGSIFALLGSNGAGKTTVVKILSTLLKADTGTARVNGFDVATQSADVRESISLTGQFAAVDEILTGRENLVLVARLRHLKEPGAIADDLLGASR